jgi:asparagine synthase (glutamine-hydrolysing)
MCGLAGLVTPPGVAPDRGTLERMTRTLSRRGPDGEGFFVDARGGCGLGHRRLSIIDLSGGAQPLGTDDGKLQTVVNGEIYNFLAVRAELEAHGHRFKTHSDSEVVIHGYRQWGRDVFAKLHGMFAIALWDVDARRLLLARDRMGKKPLYYAQVGDDGGTFIFGSELGALSVHPELSRAIDPLGLASYLTYECLPEEQTLYGEARKLLPGHVLELDRERGRLHTWAFWSLRFDQDAGVPDLERRSEDELAAMLRDRIRDATEARLMADVPLGVFLSGGIDSSTIAAAMCELMPPREVKSFSITFDDPSFDEGPYARLVAQHLGTDHHEERLSPRVMLDILPEVADFMSEPIGDASVIPTYLLSRFARRSVTVALGGDGGDELFLGYPTFVADRAARWLDGLVGADVEARLGRAVSAAARLLPVSRRNMSLDFKVKRFAQGLGFPPDERHQAWMGSFLPQELEALLEPDVAELALSTDPYAIVRSYRGAAGARDALDAQVYQYLRLYLIACVLVKVDRASMAASLEVRAPLLDTRVVELAAAIPGRYKLRGNVTKYLLKKAVRPWLPAEIIDRPKKGFGIPVAEWLRGPLRPLARELLAPGRLKREGLFRPEVVTRMLDEHEAGTADHRKPLWTLLALQLWMERYGPIARRTPSEPASARRAPEPTPTSVVYRTT